MQVPSKKIFINYTFNLTLHLMDVSYTFNLTI